MRKLVLPFLLFLNYSILSAIIMQPYLQAVTNNSVYVLVETNTPDTVTVQYGLTVSYGLTVNSETIVSTSQSTFIHNVKISGLLPNNTYFYRAVQGPSISQGYTFNTAVQSTAAFRFAWMADTRTGTTTHDQIASLINSYNPRFSLYGGDLCYDSNYTTWKNEFFRAAELNLISKYPFFNAIGNHENNSGNTKAFLQAPQSSSGIQDYYSFNYGSMHVLVLNNMLPYGPGTPQYNFAQTDLSTATNQWKIVICHFPVYCGGGHGEDSLMIIMANNIFVPNNVDLVISGHSHFYQHNKVGNIHYMIIGSAGAPLADPINKPYTIISVKNYNFAITDVSPDAFIMKVYNNNNVLLDTLNLFKNPIAVKREGTLIKNFELRNFPNPFNAETMIRFTVPAYSNIRGNTVPVKITIYDAQGIETENLLDKEILPGEYDLKWLAGNYPSGVYYCKLQSVNFEKAIEIVLIK